MNDKDQKLLEEAYTQIQEGFWDRMKAKSGTRLADLGNKALGGVAKMAGQDSRLGQMAGQMQQAGQMDVEEKRASQLTASLAQKLDKMYNEFTKDAQKLGIDITKLAQEDYKAKGEGGSYPALAGLSQFLRSFNQAKEAITKKIAPTA
jgi:hypothetical protein